MGSKLTYLHNDTLTTLFSKDNPGDYGDNKHHFISKIQEDGKLLWNSYVKHEATNYYDLADVGVDKQAMYT
jgi:hypothetical protein